jgi:hypothetical protein
VVVVRPAPSWLVVVVASASRAAWVVAAASRELVWVAVASWASRLPPAPSHCNAVGAAATACGQGGSLNWPRRARTAGARRRARTGSGRQTLGWTTTCGHGGSENRPRRVRRAPLRRLAQTNAGSGPSPEGTPWNRPRRGAPGCGRCDESSRGTNAGGAGAAIAGQGGSAYWPRRGGSAGRRDCRATAGTAGGGADGAICGHGGSKNWPRRPTTPRRAPCADRWSGTGAPGTGGVTQNLPRRPSAAQRGLGPAWPASSGIHVGAAATACGQGGSNRPPWRSRPSRWKDGRAGWVCSGIQVGAAGAATGWGKSKNLPRRARWPRQRRDTGYPFVRFVTLRTRPPGLGSDSLGARGSGLRTRCRMRWIRRCTTPPAAPMAGPRRIGC